MSIKETLQILEELENILEFTEEPDAFETQAEKELAKKLNAKILQGYKERKPTVREAILSNLYEHFKTYKFLRDLQLYEYRVQFWIPYNKRTWLSEWERTSHSLPQANLKIHTYNAAEGYIVEIS